MDYQGKQKYSWGTEKKVIFLRSQRTVIVSNFIASIIFFLTGLMIIYLKYIGKLGMEDTEGFTKMITNASGYVNNIVGGNIVLNIIFVALLILGLYKIAKKLRNLHDSLIIYLLN